MTRAIVKVGALALLTVTLLGTAAQAQDYGRDDGDGYREYRHRKQRYYDQLGHERNMERMSEMRRVHRHHEREWNYRHGYGYHSGNGDGGDY